MHNWIQFDELKHNVRSVSKAIGNFAYTFLEICMSLSSRLNFSFGTPNCAVDSPFVVTMLGKDCLLPWLEVGLEVLLEPIIPDVPMDFARRFSTLLSVSVDILICNEGTCLSLSNDIQINKSSNETYLFLCWSMSFIKICTIIWQWNFAKSKSFSFVVSMAFSHTKSKPKERNISLPNNFEQSVIEDITKHANFS